MARLPARIGEVDQDSADLDRFIESNTPFTAFTSLYNAIGCPAANLPIHKADGLPVGAMLAGPLGADRDILNVAAGVERASDLWHATPPDVAA